MIHKSLDTKHLDKLEEDGIGIHFILQNVLSSEGKILQGITSVISNLNNSGLPTLNESIPVRQVCKYLCPYSDFLFYSALKNPHLSYNNPSQNEQIQVGGRGLGSGWMKIYK